jgi:hypothetical protein
MITLDNSNIDSISIILLPALDASAFMCGNTEKLEDNEIFQVILWACPEEQYNSQDSYSQTCY